jgi:hypothetical protein
MRLQSPECEHSVKTAKRLMKALLLCAAIGLAADGVSQSAAQGTATDVAYVETVSGGVVASSQGTLTTLDALDIIGDQTRLNLQANSELRICHYRTRKIVRLSGPLRAAISASGVTAESGKAIDPTSETCAAPVVSTFQGGFVTRNIALVTTDVPLRPSIKVVDRGTKAIRKIALWDDMQQTILATFNRKMARPLLDHGKSYLLVIEQSDGGELKMLLQASEATRTGPLIVVVR